MKQWNRNIRKQLYLSFIIFFISITCFIIYVKVQGPGNHDSITMKRAYDIAYSVMHKVNPQALLAAIHSQDSMNNSEDYRAGRKGLRRYWNFDFAVPNSGKHWIVMIRDRKITDLIPVSSIPMEPSNLINYAEIQMDSKEALKIAIKEYQMKPGEVWAIGYHFALSKEKGNMLLEVIGRDKSNKFARITIDTEKKTVIRAFHKISIGGGIYNGRTDAAIVQNVNINGIRYATASDNRTALYAWGMRFLNIIQYQPLILKANIFDKNLSWNEITFPYDIYNLFPITENSYYILCAQSIYQCSNADKCTMILQLKGKEYILDEMIYHGSLYVATNQNLYIMSTGSNQWVKVHLPNRNETSKANKQNDTLDINQISIDFNDEGTIFISIDRSIYRLDHSNWIQLLTSCELINDIAFLDQSLVYVTNSSILVYDQNKPKEVRSKINIIKLIKSKYRYLYAISDRNKLYRIGRELDKPDYLVTKINTNERNGLITDVVQLDETTWYYSTNSKSEWVKLEKEK